MYSILRKIFRSSSSTMLEGAKVIHETKKAYLVEHVGQNTQEVVIGFYEY